MPPEGSHLGGNGARPMRSLPRRARNLFRRALLRLRPEMRRRLKYEGESQWWREERERLHAWYRGELELYGIPTPTDADRREVSPIVTTNAVWTLHHMVPRYRAILGIEKNEFSGKRLLEVGCGALAPILQFADCERHGLDPLIDEYVRQGWPLYDYGVSFVNAAAEAMPYVDGYFDAAISVNALDHVDDFARAAAEMQRVVRKGGRLYLEIDYHAPRLLEPQALDDDVVRAAFGGCEMEKICTRTEREQNRLLVETFGLRPEAVAPDQDESVMVVWHGTRL